MNPWQKLALNGAILAAVLAAGIWGYLNLWLESPPTPLPLKSSG